MLRRNRQLVGTFARAVAASRSVPVAGILHDAVPHGNFDSSTMALPATSTRALCTATRLLLCPAAKFHCSICKKQFRLRTAGDLHLSHRHKGEGTVEEGPGPGEGSVAGGGAGPGGSQPAGAQSTPPRHNPLAGIPFGLGAPPTGPTTSPQKAEEERKRIEQQIMQEEAKNFRPMLSRFNLDLPAPHLVIPSCDIEALLKRWDQIAWKRLGKDAQNYKPSSKQDYIPTVLNKGDSFTVDGKTMVAVDGGIREKLSGGKGADKKQDPEFDENDPDLADVLPIDRSKPKTVKVAPKEEDTTAGSDSKSKDGAKPGSKKTEGSTPTRAPGMGEDRQTTYIRSARQRAPTAMGGCPFAVSNYNPTSRITQASSTTSATAATPVRGTDSIATAHGASPLSPFAPPPGTDPNAPVEVKPIALFSDLTMHNRIDPRIRFAVADGEVDDDGRVEGMDRFTCKFCAKVFVRESSRESHILSKHIEVALALEQEEALPELPAYVPSAVDLSVPPLTNPKDLLPKKVTSWKDVIVDPKLEAATNMVLVGEVLGVDMGQFGGKDVVAVTVRLDDEGDVEDSEPQRLAVLWHNDNTGRPAPVVQIGDVVTVTGALRLQEDGTTTVPYVATNSPGGSFNVIQSRADASVSA